MKTNLFLLTMLCGMTCFGQGVELSLKSAADYYYTQPVCTNNIKGLGMGPGKEYMERKGIRDANDGYNVLRSEDIAFNKEATTERALNIGLFEYDNYNEQYFKDIPNRELEVDKAGKEFFCRKSNGSGETKDGKKYSTIGNPIMMDSYSIIPGSLDGGTGCNFYKYRGTKSNIYKFSTNENERMRYNFVVSKGAKWDDNWHFEKLKDEWYYENGDFFCNVTRYLDNNSYLKGLTIDETNELKHGSNPKSSTIHSSYIRNDSLDNNTVIVYPGTADMYSYARPREVSPASVRLELVQKYESESKHVWDYDEEEQIGKILYNTTNIVTLKSVDAPWRWVCRCDYFKYYHGTEYETYVWKYNPSSGKQEKKWFNWYDKISHKTSFVEAKIKMTNQLVKIDSSVGLNEYYLRNLKTITNIQIFAVSRYEFIQPYVESSMKDTIIDKTEQSVIGEISTQSKQENARQEFSSYVPTNSILSVYAVGRNVEIIEKDNEHYLSIPSQEIDVSNIFETFFMTLNSINDVQIPHIGVHKVEKNYSNETSEEPWRKNIDISYGEIRGTIRFEVDMTSYLLVICERKNTATFKYK